MKLFTTYPVSMDVANMSNYNKQTRQEIWEYEEMIGLPVANLDDDKGKRLCISPKLAYFLLTPNLS
jgi:hypothetical protein